MSESNVAVQSTEVAADAAVAVAAPKKKPGARKNPNSPFALSKSLFLKLTAEGKTRKEIIAEFVGQYGLTPNTAQMYYHYAKVEAKANGTLPAPAAPAVAEGDTSATETV